MSEMSYAKGSIELVDAAELRAGPAASRSRPIVLARARANARMRMSGTPSSKPTVLFRLRQVRGVTVRRKHKMTSRQVAALIREYIDAIDHGEPTAKFYERARLAGYEITED